MARMTELEALELLTRAAALIPVLTDALRAIRAEWADGAEADLAARIAAAHTEVQALDAQLQALRGA